MGIGCEIQTGFDTIAYYHSLSPKQKRAILKELTKLSKFRTIVSDYENDTYAYTSDHFADKGVKVHISRITGSVWGLYIIVHPMLVLGNDDRSALYEATKPSYKKMVKRVDAILAEVDVPCSLDMMSLYRNDITMNIVFDGKEVVDEYIRILKKSKLIPQYKPDWFREKDKKAKDCTLANQHSHKQRCKSAAFFAYDKTAQLEMIDHFPEALIGKTVLRLEVQLRRKADKKWVRDKKLGSNWEIIRDVYKNRRNILKWYLNKLQPECKKYVRYKDAVELVKDTKMKEKLRERMLYLLRKTSDKYSLSAALDDIRKKFGLKKGQYPSCSEVKKIAPQNYTTSNLSENDLIEQGYSTCGRCH